MSRLTLTILVVVSCVLAGTVERARADARGPLAIEAAHLDARRAAIPRNRARLERRLLHRDERRLMNRIAGGLRERQLPSVDQMEALRLVLQHSNSGGP